MRRRLWKPLSRSERNLTQEEGADALAGIAAVEIGSYDVAIEIIGRDPEKWRPATRETADHSFPYCVAAALLDGQVTLHSFEPKRLTDPALQELMKKVRVVHSPNSRGATPRPCRPGSRSRRKQGKST